jgi:hypothetical protein
MTRSHLMNRRSRARAIGGVWQGASDAHTRPAVAGQGTSNATRRCEVLLSCGWRRFSTWVALLLGHRSPRICSLVDALPKPKIDSHAALPIYEMPSKQSGHLSGILAGDLGIDPEYRHVPKRVTPGEMLETSGVVLKWYAIHPGDRPVPDEITQLARSYLIKSPLEARGTRLCPATPLRQGLLFPDHLHVA